MTMKPSAPASIPLPEGSDRVEEALVESFPASDPSTSTPVNVERAATYRVAENAQIPSGADQGARCQAAESGAPGSPQDELAHLKDQLLRVLAEQQNVRRRAALEREEAVRFAATGFARDLLPAADNLRRAIESVTEDDVAPNDLLRALLAGIASRTAAPSRAGRRQQRATEAIAGDPGTSRPTLEFGLQRCAAKFARRPRVASFPAPARRLCRGEGNPWPPTAGALGVALPGCKQPEDVQRVETTSVQDICGRLEQAQPSPTPLSTPAPGMGLQLKVAYTNAY